MQQRGAAPVHPLPTTQTRSATAHQPEAPISRLRALRYMVLGGGEEELFNAAIVCLQTSYGLSLELITPPSSPTAKDLEEINLILYNVTTGRSES